jgi:chromatin remodeling complex protein RSC6
MRKLSSKRRGSAAHARSSRGGEAAKRRQAGIQRPVKPDDVLAKIVGPRAQARTQMVKQIWKYIKSHHLQDPKDGRVICPDGPLGRVLGDKRRVSMFEIARFLNLHLAPTP